MDKEETTKRPIGKILVESGLLSAAELNLALLEQAHTTELLGQVLVSIGVLDPADMTVKLAAGVRRMLGTLLVKAGQITQAQLELVVSEQKRTGERIGEIFVRLGLLTEHQLNDLLDCQNNRGFAQEYASPLRLGELLVSTGRITSEQLDDALQKQKISGKKLGEVLIEEGYARPHHIKRGLRSQRMLLTSALAAVLSLGSIAAHGHIIGQAQADCATIEMQLPAVDLEPYLQAKAITLQVIHLPAGTYRIATTLRLPSNTVLEGEGDATIIKADGPFIGSQVITNADYVNGNMNIFIRNVRMEVTLPALPGDQPGILRFRNVEHLEIDNVTMVVDSPMYGIDLSAEIGNATVQGCTITNINKVSGGGVVIRNGSPLPAKATSGIVVRNNVIESAGDEAVSVFGWEGLVGNVRIENNTIKAEGVASFGIAAYGIDSYEQSGQLSGVDIVGNSIEGGRVGGIGVMGGAEQINIVNNHVTGTTNDGIFLHPGGERLPAVGDVRISQNTISNIGRHGIFANGLDVEVDQNEITNCAQTGIYAAARVSIVGNVVSIAHPGILVEAKSSAIISDNLLNNAGEIVFLH